MSDVFSEMVEERLRQYKVYRDGGIPLLEASLAAARANRQHDDTCEECFGGYTCEKGIELREKARIALGLPPETGEPTETNDA